MLFEQEDIVLDIQKELWSDQLISQQVLLSKMEQAINQNRFPHFSLIYGRPGNGQLLMGLSLAQTLLCTAALKPCGICDSCRKVMKMIHPDLHFSFPLNNPKETCQQHYASWRAAIQEKPFMGISHWFNALEGDRKNANISVVEIGNVLSTLSLKPFEAKHSVLLLWLPEYLGKDSNRLLKFFEEPPDHVYIILLAENLELLLPTVLSRAQLFRLSAIDKMDAIQYLKNNGDFNEEQLLSAFISTNGNIQEALDYLANQNVPSIDSLRILLQVSYTYNVIGMNEWIEKFATWSKEEQKNFFLWVQQVLSLVIREKYKLKPRTESSSSPVLNYALKLSGSLQINQIESWNELMNDALLYLQRNANVKLMMTNFCIQLAHILRNVKHSN